MAERLAESRWFYSQPTSGIVEEWFKRNEENLRETWGDPWVLDNAFILNAVFTSWTAELKERYTRDQVIMTKDGPHVPVEDSELWNVWQEYTNSPKARDDFNGSKLHLHSYSRVLTDTKLRLVTSQYDWHRMRTLGMGLRDGVLPNGEPFPQREEYRDNFLPVRVNGGYVFLPENHANNLVVQVTITTADNYLLTTKQPDDADYYPGAINATIAEQMHGQRDTSPFDTVERAVSKVGGEELKLTLIPEETRLAAMAVELDCNAVAMMMTARCAERSDQIDASVLGIDKDEFDQKYRIGKYSLEKPDELVQLFYNPHLLHGLSRIRIVAALSDVHGYEGALDILYQSKR